MRHVVAVLLLLTSITAMASSAELSDGSNWKQLLHERLASYGHRNWIVVADSAYPAQSREGIETIVVNADQIQVLKHVLTELDASRHVRPNILIDSELKYVPESDANGISSYRTDLNGLLQGRNQESVPHEQIISKLDAAGQTFRILIIKTRMAIPYTSVFLQLDCAYWSADSEKKLRAAMATEGK